MVFCLFATNTVAQEPLEKQIWSFAQLNILKTKTQQFFDVGFRSYDHFIRDPRQWFVRYHVQGKIGESNLWLGGGLAYFETTTTSNDWNGEVRPFVQGIYFCQKEQVVFRIRYRNEFRYYLESKEIIDRNRLQFQFQFNTGIRNVKGLIGYETFYGIGLEKPWEQRLLTGFQLEMTPKWLLLGQYQFQRQQRAKGVNQHILTIGLIYQLKNY